VARMNTGIDGGMHRVFAAKLPDGNTGLSEGGDTQGLSLLAVSRAPGTIPSHVNPPKPKLTPEEEPQVAASSTSAPATRVAAAPAQREAAPQSEGFFSSLARRVGIGGSETTASATQAAKPKAESKPAASQSIVRATAAAPKPAEPARQTAAAKPAAPALKPSVSETPAAAPAPVAKDTTIAGAQPVVQSNSFESRFGAMR